MHLHPLLKYVALACLCASICPALSAQSQDVAEAARQAKLKKQQKAPDSAKPSANSKTYTNDDIPESKAAVQDPSSEKTGPPAVSKPGNAKTDEAKTTPANNSATVTVGVPNSAIKHPGGSEINWSMQNTSDHTINVTVTLDITGPCKYHYQTSRAMELNAGSGYTDNMFGFAVYENSCPGSYDVELRVSAYGKVLSTATASATVI